MKKVAFVLVLVAAIVGIVFGGLSMASASLPVGPNQPPYPTRTPTPTPTPAPTPCCDAMLAGINTLSTTVTNIETAFTNLQAMETDYDMVEVAHGVEDFVVASPPFSGVVHVSLTVHTWEVDKADEQGEEDDLVWVYCRALDKEGSGWSTRGFDITGNDVTVLEFDAVGNETVHPWSLKASNRADDVFHNEFDLSVFYIYTMTYPKL